MQQKKAIMSKSLMIGATETASRRVKSWLDLARKVTEDSDKAARLERQECKGCFYSSRMGGAAMTSRDCMCCDKSQLFGSTNTDVLCQPCAVAESLCKHCGGDLELRTQRRKWPAAYQSETPG